jgi:hypothetical protein
MTKIVDIEPYRLARVLINLLQGDAECHARVMIQRMVRRRDPAGEARWREIAEAMAALRHHQYWETAP